MIQDIGIIDTKKIISSIKEFHNFDFSDYSLTTFKRRVVKVANLLNYTNIADFISQIENEAVFNKIIDEISIDTTEMFRDPPMWREIRDKFIPELYKDRNFKVWFPEISSGDEVFSLAIVLKEAGLLDKTKIIVTGMSQRKLDMIKNGGQYEVKKIESNEANYKRYSDQFELSNYYKIQNNKIQFDDSLLKGVEFQKHNLLNDKTPGSFRMIIYQNKMIYYNQTLQDKLASKIVDSLMPGGILFIGNKETLDTSGVNKKLILVNPEEKIYKKRVI